MPQLLNPYYDYIGGPFYKDLRYGYSVYRQSYRAFYWGEGTGDGSLCSMGNPYSVSILSSVLSYLNFYEFDFYCLICAERQQHEYRFCPQPLLPHYGKDGAGMSNCCDSPTHIFDEHHPLAVSSMRCGLAGKENTTTAELYDRGAKGSELSR
eukprot:2073912-Pleurochrysis_carterae.AAC.1